MFGDSSLPAEQYHKLLVEAQAFIWACYNMSDCESLNTARVKVWNNKMRRNALEPPKLSSLPPTELAFRENALRGHLAASIMLDCLKAEAPVFLQKIMGGTSLKVVPCFNQPSYHQMPLLLLLNFLRSSNVAAVLRGLVPQRGAAAWDMDLVVPFSATADRVEIVTINIRNNCTTWML